MNRTVLIVTRWSVVVGYMYLIYVVSGRPISLPEITIPGIGIDKLLHVLEYGVLALFLCRAFSATFGSVLARRSLFAVASIALIYAAMDEMHQYFIPSRYCSVFDFVADAIGVISVTCLWPTASARWPILKA